jgi:hypothetical protein
MFLTPPQFNRIKQIAEDYVGRLESFRNLSGAPFCQLQHLTRHLGFQLSPVFCAESPEDLIQDNLDDFQRNIMFSELYLKCLEVPEVLEKESTFSGGYLERVSVKNKEYVSCLARRLIVEGKIPRKS